eukprot:CAMPEP_0206426274 /NCGR_PEP_ID=MMETSP0324_2-20121206/4277_1 /ASSEMBLY_ACC=CAM_ASM_000836 /TAXON_ID=2866 /ORGANISM="Crypthecodinium cohnii, Strain Seligo" /LENGTH=216 /DNA_ID=CAMNT_0053891191 /DNA_START=186 /DNA_END=836 /DNA_ORIENTATION=-
MASRRFCAAAASDAAAPPTEPAKKIVLAGKDLSALEGFRKRGAPEVAAMASAGPGGISVEGLQRALRIQADAELESNSDVDVEGVKAAIIAETVDVVEKLKDLQATLAEQSELEKEKADVLAVGFQRTGAENQEFAALVICATAGIFAVSLHAGFFVIWLFAYALYKRSTRQIREQRAASSDLGELVARLHELESSENELRDSLKKVAKAWAEGRA